MNTMAWAPWLLLASLASSASEGPPPSPSARGGMERIPPPDARADCEFLKGNAAWHAVDARGRGRVIVEAPTCSAPFFWGRLVGPALVALKVGHSANATSEAHLHYSLRGAPPGEYALELRLIYCDGAVVDRTSADLKRACVADPTCGPAHGPFSVRWNGDAYPFQGWRRTTAANAPFWTRMQLPACAPPKIPPACASPELRAGSRDPLPKDDCGASSAPGWQSLPRIGGARLAEREGLYDWVGPTKDKFLANKAAARRALAAEGDAWELCFVGASHTRNLADSVRVGFGWRNRVGAKVVFLKGLTVLPHQVAAALEARPSCTHAWVGTGQWGAYTKNRSDRRLPYAAPDFERRVDDMLSRIARLPNLKRVWLKSMNYLPLAACILNCPPTQDWRNPAVTHAYNRALWRAARRQPRVEFVSVEAAIAPQYDMAQDWNHPSGKAHEAQLSLVYAGLARPPPNY